MIFYYALKTVSVASHITLEEVGADYKERPIDFGNAEQRSETYLGINPKGRVPALATEGGILTETPAILLYLAQRFPESGMAPLNDPFALAKLQEFNAYLCATVHVAHAHRVRGARWVDDESAIKAMQAKVPQTMGECFGLLEAEMFRGPWVMGGQYTICDPYLFTVSNWLEGDGVDPDEFPSIAAHNRRMRERPAVARVAAIHGV
ncbi:MAG TPA: glutathione S-transferase [Gammaproteobacteria bacterium]|nr:glutathione S-transferase [Gammaproteobacteria bacterium]|tara:strand:+ start:488 stop:1105 length:618 start_codon:yes stop_codon:yes gene_type:complete